jgi:ABC-type dipeptide/oligopeptide/nickel transport system permease subunit
LEVGIVAVAMAAVLGVSVGLISGYAGGLVDLLTQRLVDVMLAFPTLILALVIVGALGKKEITYVFLAVGIAASPGMARVVRGSVLSAKENAYIEAARTIGANPWRIVLWHILPNVVAPIIIIATVGLGQAILAEAVLSFLGMGVQPPDPSWGNMIQGLSMGEMMSGIWWIAAFPSIAITLAVLGFNLLGDALRDVLDPRLRHA